MDSILVAIKSINTPENIQLLIIGIGSALGAAIVIWIVRLVVKGKLKIVVIGEYFHSLQKRKRRSIALCNDLIQCLDRSNYNHRYETNDKEPIYPDYDYSSIKLSQEFESKLSDFLRQTVNPGYEENASLSGVKSRNVVSNEINEGFPIIYERLYKLLGRGYCNRKDVRKLF